MEKRIILEEIDPVEIYGVNNRLFDLLASHFPKIKAFARGSEIQAVGPDDDLERFEAKINALIAKRMRKSNLNEYDVESLFEDEMRNPEEGVVDLSPEKESIILFSTDGKPIKARTHNQKRMVEEYYRNDLLFAVGPAGSGKTYTAIALAVRALKNREVKRLILTRPAVEAGERLGFLPGDLKEKLDPYLQPLYDALGDMIPSKRLQSFIEEGIIQIAPLAYMRGRTLDRAFVILDEAQNTSLGQLKMFLTRMGCDAKFIVTGDATQIDLPNKKDSGLLRGVELCRNIKGVSVIEFGKEDIVRHPLVTKIVSAFEREAE
ncbi:MAG: PhoH family protein [Bacteroidales bacterium]|nr:PhoH family protein [Candidatus Cacconaster merdequi]